MRVVVDFDERSGVVKLAETNAYRETMEAKKRRGRLTCSIKDAAAATGSVMQQLHSLSVCSA